MYLEIYPDVVFVLNFVLDFILLLMLMAVNRKKFRILRLSSAAAIGALAAVIVSLAPWLESMQIMANGRSLCYFLYQTGLFLLKVASFLFMLRIALGKMKWKELLKQGVIMLLLHLTLGGLMNSLYYYTNIREYVLNLGSRLIISNLSIWFVLAVMLAALLLGLGLIAFYRLCRRNSRETYEVKLCLDKKSVATIGLYDTGNCLYDPVIHRPVIVVEDGIMDELLRKEWGIGLQDAQNYLSPTDKTIAEDIRIEAATAWDQALEQSELSDRVLPRIRFIPYSSIGKAKGMMMGLMLNKVLIQKGEETLCREKIIAAVCDWRLSPGKEYHVILHKDLL